MNSHTDLQSSIFATVPVHGNVSIMTPLVRLIVRLVRRAASAVRQRTRGQISSTSRDALVRDGFSIDQHRFVDGPLAHPHHHLRRSIQ